MDLSTSDIIGIVGVFFAPTTAFTAWLWRKSLKTSAMTFVDNLTKPGTATAEQHNIPRLTKALRAVGKAKKSPRSTRDATLLDNIHNLLLDCHSKRHMHLIQHTVSIALRCSFDAVYLLIWPHGLLSQADPSDRLQCGDIKTTREEGDWIVGQLVKHGLATTVADGCLIQTATAVRIADMVDRPDGAFVSASQWDESSHDPPMP